MFINWADAEESFDSLLDDGGDVTVAGLDFLPSAILRKMDPIAYRTYLMDYIDSCGVDSDDLDGECSV